MFEGWTHKYHFLCFFWVVKKVGATFAIYLAVFRIVEDSKNLFGLHVGWAHGRRVYTVLVQVGSACIASRSSGEGVAPRG